MNACPSKKELGDRIKMLRERAGYKSRAAFAEALGMKPTKYQEYEMGRSRIDLALAWEIADLLGISLDDLGGRNFSPSSSIADDERRILADYRACTPERKREASQYVRERRAFSEEHANGSTSFDKAVNE